MKKILLALALATSILLCGCSSEAEKGQLQHLQAG